MSESQLNYVFTQKNALRFLLAPVMMGLPGRERSLTISSSFWIQCTNVTVGRTDTGR